MSRKDFHLKEELDWAPDLEELEEKTTKLTKLIAVCNPNNPTGHILSAPDMEAIINVADHVGAWILADETYAGTERLTDSITPTFWGAYDKVVVTASLSKAYGLPGLRLGWVVGPSDIIDDIWMRHEYTTISATMFAYKLSVIALAPAVRSRLIERGRGYIHRGYPILKSLVENNPQLFSLVPLRRRRSHSSIMAWKSIQLSCSSA